MKEKIVTLPNVYSDTPSAKDKFGRSNFAKALALLIKNAEPPCTIGLYGGWGSGKSTLMQLVADELSNNFQVVTFNAWEHQNDNSIPVALMHALADQAGAVGNKRVIKDLKIVGGVLGSEIFKRLSGISAISVARSVSDIREAEFQIRSERARIQTRIKSLISAACPKQEKIVFFIDDLDRCEASKALELIEALKIYFELDRCIFVVAADRDALLKSIPGKNYDYLEKIFSLELYIPYVDREARKKYIFEHVPHCEEKTAEMIVLAAGNNPRKIKRLINRYVFTLGLAMSVNSDDLYSDFTEEMARIVLLGLILHDSCPKLHELLGSDTWHTQRLVYLCLTGENSFSDRLAECERLKYISEPLLSLLHNLPNNIKGVFDYINPSPFEAQSYLLALADITKGNDKDRLREHDENYLRHCFKEGVGRNPAVGELEYFNSEIKDMLEKHKSWSPLLKEEFNRYPYAYILVHALKTFEREDTSKNLRMHEIYPNIMSAAKAFVDDMLKQYIKESTAQEEE